MVLMGHLIEPALVGLVLGWLIALAMLHGKRLKRLEHRMMMQEHRSRVSNLEALDSGPPLMGD